MRIWHYSRENIFVNGDWGIPWKKIGIGVLIAAAVVGVVAACIAFCVAAVVAIASSSAYIAAAAAVSAVMVRAAPLIMRVASAVSSGINRSSPVVVSAGEKGRIGIQSAGVIQNTAKITAPITGNSRIPDVLVRSASNVVRVIGEVKNTKTLSLTSQLKDYVDIANQSGVKLELYTRDTTELSGPLKELIENGTIIHRTF